MTISEYIEKLTKLRDEHGDLRVTTSRRGDPYFTLGPDIEHLRINKPREHSVKFWWSGNGEEFKGEKVVRL